MHISQLHMSNLYPSSVPKSRNKHSPTQKLLRVSCFPEQCGTTSVSSVRGEGKRGRYVFESWGRKKKLTVLYNSHFVTDFIISFQRQLPLYRTRGRIWTHINLQKDWWRGSGSWKCSLWAVASESAGTDWLDMKRAGFNPDLNQDLYYYTLQGVTYLLKAKKLWWLI